MIWSVDNPSDRAMIPARMIDGHGLDIGDVAVTWCDLDTGEAVVIPQRPDGSVIVEFAVGDDCHPRIRREWRQFQPPLRVVPRRPLG